MRFHELLENADTILALTPQELAMPLLQELVRLEDERGTGQPHRYNFDNSYCHNLESEVRRAVMEAWGWLETSGCLAARPGDSSGGSSFVTRRGRELAASADTTAFTRESLLPRHLLHPIIEQRCWSAFLRGQYDSAVFEAFKQLEVSIRSRSGLADTDIGVSLARKAFHGESGKLTDSAVVPSERQALQDLMAGALGSYKNPHSHRNVALKDPGEAAEMIILASHLIRIVEARPVGSAANKT